MILYWAKVFALLALGFFLGFGCYLEWAATQSDKQLTAQASSILTDFHSNMLKTFKLINDDCGKNPCGLIANANKVLIKSGDAIVQTQLTEKQVAISIAPPTIGAMNKLGTAADSLGVAANSLGKTSDELTKTLKITNDKDNGLPAILANTNGAVTDFRSYMKSQAMKNLATDIQRTVHFTADTTENVASITKDLSIQAKKLNAPKTKTQEILQWAPIGVKVGITVTCAILGPC